MNIFLRILNKIRFGEIENIGTEESGNISYQKGYSRKPYKVAPGFSLLKNGKVLQKNVLDVVSKFSAPEKAKNIVNGERFLTINTDKAITIFTNTGAKLFELESENTGSHKVSYLDGEHKKIEIHDTLVGQKYFVFIGNESDSFITEPYVKVSELENGKRKVVAFKTNKFGQQSTYFLDENLLPCSAKFVEASEELEDGTVKAELYQSSQMQNSSEYEPVFAVCDSEMKPISARYAKIEKAYGHWLATDINGEQRFIDKNGRNRSYPIDKIVNIGNGTLLIKRNHSSNWDIQREDNLKFVVKGINKAIHNSETGLTFGFYEGKAVLFGYDPSNMHAVDGDTARLVLNLLNKTRMGSKFVDKVQANQEEMDKTLSVFKTVLSKNLEQNPNNTLIKRLVGSSSKSLDRRFINHLIGIYRAREKRDNKTISEIESQISSIESQISSLNNRLKLYRDKRGVVSEAYNITLESKERLERKLSVLQTGLTTHVNLLSSSTDEETTLEYAGIQCLTPEVMEEMRSSKPATTPSTEQVSREETEEEILISKYAGSQPQLPEKGDEE